MLKNYLKVALRNLWKEKLVSSISLVGVAIWRNVLAGLQRIQLCNPLSVALSPFTLKWMNPSAAFTPDCNPLNSSIVLKKSA